VFFLRCDAILVARSPTAMHALTDLAIDTRAFNSFGAKAALRKDWFKFATARRSQGESSQERRDPVGGGTSGHRV
jgi:hypothetical protein